GRARGARCGDRPAAGRERKAQDAACPARRHGARQERGSVAEIRPAEEARAEGRRGWRAQDRDPAAERRGHGPRHVLPGACLAAADRNGPSHPEGCRRGQDLIRPSSSSRSAPSTVSANTITSSLLAVETRGTGFVDISREVAKFLREAGAREGVVTLF